MSRLTHPTGKVFLRRARGFTASKWSAAPEVPGSGVVARIGNQHGVGCANGALRAAPRRGRKWGRARAFRAIPQARWSSSIGKRRAVTALLRNPRLVWFPPPVAASVSEWRDFGGFRSQSVRRSPAREGRDFFIALLKVVPLRTPRATMPTSESGSYRRSRRHSLTLAATERQLVPPSVFARSSVKCLNGTNRAKRRPVSLASARPRPTWSPGRIRRSSWCGSCRESDRRPRRCQSLPGEFRT